MRELNLRLPRDKRPLYLRIAEAVRAAIKNGEALPQEKLPSTRELALRFRTHRHTVMAAFDELIAEGWVNSRQRQGYEVCETIPSAYFESSALIPTPEILSNFEFRTVREVPPRELLGSERPKYNFRSGLPDLREFPFGEFKSHLSDALKRLGPGALDYGPPEGHPAFLSALEIYLRRVRSLSGRSLIVTHGSQEAIFLTGQLLLKPGDKVAVEAMGYSPAWEALRLAGAELVPVSIDEEGIDPQALEKVLKKGRVRLIYTTPLHQYPTTVTLPLPRRLRLYELSSKYGVPILEDDYDHEFHFRSQPLAPIASHDKEGLVIYVSTFSKVLYPSARLGFMAVSPKLATKLSAIKRVTSRQNDTLLQETMVRWMKDGGLERHMRRMRRVYQERRDVMIDFLGHEGAGLDLDWKVPDGGMAVWVNINRDSEALARAAARAGIHVMHESNSQFKKGQGHHLRLGYANQRAEEIREGLRILMSLMKKMN